MNRKSLTKRFYGLLKETNRQQYKETLVAAYSSKQSTSLKDLTDAKLQSLVDFLSVGSTNTTTLQDVSCNRMRRTIIAICTSTFGMVKDGKADMQRIYEYVLHKGYKKKHLNDYSASELQNLVSQFQAIQDWTTNKNSSNLKKSEE